ncbi:glycosyltransferase [Vibrio cyclitrophicus]
MEKIKITIATVSFNDSKNLKSTIDNIKDIKSKYKIDFDIQFIVKDGGSLDCTDTICNEALDENIIDVYLSKKDLGIYDAMNQVWEIIDKERYVIFLGAGDKIINLPSSVSFTYPAILGTTYIGPREFKSRVSLKLFIGNSVHHQSVFLHKGNIDNPFDLRFPRYSDFNLMQKLFLRYKIIYIIDDNFVAYADPYGVTSKLDVFEVAKVVNNNFNVIITFLSILYGCWTKIRERF